MIIYFICVYITSVFIVMLFNGLCFCVFICLVFIVDRPHPYIYIGFLFLIDKKKGRASEKRT